MFNLAANRRVSASATCGEGVQEPELYCYLVGSNKPGNEVTDEDDEKRLLIQGQVSGTFIHRVAKWEWAGHILVLFQFMKDKKQKKFTKKLDTGWKYSTGIPSCYCKETGT